MSRCSDASRARGEPLWATASTVRTFLLMEDPGPWGPQVLHSHRLPPELRAVLSDWRRQVGLRPLLIRRPGRSAPGPRRVFIANARFGWLQTTVVEELGELIDLDPSDALGRDGIGWDDHPDPVVLVCTHGRHDPCCATRGRPVAAAISGQYPGLLWEASHLGGDRFAGNMVVLPRGDYFGRLDGDDGVRVVRSYLAGELDLDHHRGRSTQSWPVQAAVSAARREFRVTGFDEVVPVGLDGGVVELLVQGQRWRAEVSETLREPELLTCSAQEPEPARSYEVVLSRR